MRKIICVFLFLAAVITGAAGAEKQITVALVCSSACQGYGSKDHKFIYGWGELLPQFLDGKVKVLNFAISGSSTKSFRLHGYWDRVVKAKPDYVLLALGANDTPKTKKYATAVPEYKENQRRFVEEIKAWGGKPIFVTLNQSLGYDKTRTKAAFIKGKPLRRDRIEHSKAVREVAKELNLPCLELFDTQYNYMVAMGEEACSKLYRFDPKKGKIDPSHTNYNGAEFVAMIIAEELAKADTPLAKYVKRQEVEKVKNRFVKKAD
jgi:lysophospholipase L1-like esterase